MRQLWSQITSEDSPFDAFPELIDDRHIPLLRMALWVILGGALILTALLMTSPHGYQSRIYAGAGLAILGATAHGVLRRRGVIPTLRLLVIGCWIHVTAAGFFGEGVRAPVLVAYPIILIFGGWLVGARMCTVCLLPVALHWAPWRLANKRGASARSSRSLRAGWHLPTR